MIILSFSKMPFLLILLGYIIYLGYKPKSIDKDNKSATNLLIGSYILLTLNSLIYLMIYFFKNRFITILFYKLEH